MAPTTSENLDKNLFGLALHGRAADVASPEEFHSVLDSVGVQYLPQFMILTFEIDNQLWAADIGLGIDLDGAYILSVHVGSPAEFALENTCAPPDLHECKFPEVVAFSREWMGEAQVTSEATYDVASGVTRVTVTDLENKHRVIVETMLR